MCAKEKEPMTNPKETEPTVVESLDSKEAPPEPQPATEPLSADDVIDIESLTSSVKPDDAVDKLTKEVAELNEKVKNHQDKYIRLMAEFDNFKRRTAREYQQKIDAANEKLIMELTTPREDFERAYKAWNTETTAETLLEGIKLIFNRFDTVLKQNGLEVFGEVSEAFDPQIHDALMRLPHATIPEGNIVEIFEKGYRLKGRVIRHAKVVVSSGAPVAEETQPQQDPTH